MEDGFLAVGALTTALDGDFSRYVDAFVPYLYLGLQGHDEHQLCSISVGLIGDICRSLGEACLPYCDNFMNMLLQNLQSPILHRSVKPTILSTFGDIALAIGARFEVYLEVTMMVLQQASQMRATDGNYDYVDYVCTLRESILEAYVGIVQGLKTGEKAALLMPYISQIFTFMSICYHDIEKSVEMIRSSIGLLGDLAETFPSGELKMFLTQDWIQAMLKEGRTNRALPAKTRETARWAKEMVKRASQ
jgi:importin subunit beta-1